MEAAKPLVRLLALPMSFPTFHRQVPVDILLLGSQNWPLRKLDIANHMKVCMQMRRSSVVSANGTAGVDEIRTSYGMFLRSVLIDHFLLIRPGHLQTIPELSSNAARPIFKL